MCVCVPKGKYFVQDWWGYLGEYFACPPKTLKARKCKVKQVVFPLFYNTDIKLFTVNETHYRSHKEKYVPFPLDTEIRYVLHVYLPCAVTQTIPLTLQFPQEHFIYLLLEGRPSTNHCASTVTVGVSTLQLGKSPLGQADRHPVTLLERMCAKNSSVVTVAWASHLSTDSRGRLGLYLGS